MSSKEIRHRVWIIFKRELGIFTHRPLFLFCMIIAPVLCIIYFTSLMSAGLPTNLPCGMVDEDNTHITHIIDRTVDDLEETHIVAHYPNFTDARKAMQKGEIYAFFYFPRKTTVKAMSSRQPTISFYTNESYFVPATLLMKDLRLASELSGLALTREELYMKGMTEKQAMGIIQPLVVEAHPLDNPYLNYSVYLSNMLIPGILILLIMLSTSYTIGIEWKRETQKHLYQLAGGSPTIALLGKLLPQTLLFFLIFLFFDIYVFKFQHFPCNCGLLPMVLIGWLTVLAAQGFGVFFFGIFLGQMRLSMCLCALWGILSFSVAGFTYPVPAMSKFLQWLSVFFPLRHYYLIYVNQALDGYSIWYVWKSLLAMLIFILVPLFVLKRYRLAFLCLKYNLKS